MYKIVFVDDEFLILEGLKKIINWECYDIKIVGTARSAVDGFNIIMQENPDIVITDIKMRGKSGLDMIEELQDNGYSGYFILLSGYQEFEYASRAIDSNVYKYLLKPLDVSKLENTIKKIVIELKSKSGTLDGNKDIFNLILNYINNHYWEDIKLSHLALKYHFDVAHFSRKFKKKKGVNFVEYITNMRIDLAKRYLVETDNTVEDISERVGYKDVKHFREVFKKNVGMNPNEYKKNYKQY